MGTVFTLCCLIPGHSWNSRQHNLDFCVDNLTRHSLSNTYFQQRLQSYPWYDWVKGSGEEQTNKGRNGRERKHREEGRNACLFASVRLFWNLKVATKNVYFILGLCNIAFYSYLGIFRPYHIQYSIKVDIPSQPWDDAPMNMLEDRKPQIRNKSFW